ncbi:MAG: glycine zipper domain-containing protein [Polyangiaceae bacterium]
MKTKSKSKGHEEMQRIAHEAEGAASGALAGAVIGSGAGPPGMVAGAIIGAVAGGIAGAVMDGESARRANRTRELDEEIGVNDGDLGAPVLEHPRAETGAYSRAAVGMPSSSGGEEPAEGPTQSLDT